MVNVVTEKRRDYVIEVPTKHPDDGQCVYVIKFGNLETYVGDHGSEVDNIYEANLFPTYRGVRKRLLRHVHNVNQRIAWYNRREEFMSSQTVRFGDYTLQDWLPRPLFYESGYPVEPVIVPVTFGMGIDVQTFLCIKRTPL